MFDSLSKTVVNTGGNKFNFNVDAVSGLLHKSTRKSKFCIRSLTEDLCILNDDKPTLHRETYGDKQSEIVILQAMLAGDNKMIVEYMDRKDYDEMFDGPLPQVDVKDLFENVRDNVLNKLMEDERFKSRLIQMRQDQGKDVEEELVEDYTYHRDRSEMAMALVGMITDTVCDYLESKHIGTFDKTGKYW